MYYPTALRRVQISPKRVQISDKFSRNAEATNWIEVTRKITEFLNYFSDDEESEWLANIDPSLEDKSNEEKQLDDSEISSFS